MDSMFSWQEQYLPRSLRSLVRYCSCHSNIKFISSCHRVISSMYIQLLTKSCAFDTGNIEHCGEIFYETITFNYSVHNCMKSPRWTLFSCTFVHVCTVWPLCVHIMCFSEPALIPKIPSLMDVVFVIILFRLPQDLSAQQTGFGWVWLSSCWWGSGLHSW